MTKMEMVNRMIVLGIIKETDRNHWMRQSKDKIMRVYIKAVPIKLEFLGRAQTMAKKKNITVGTIKGIDLIKQTKPIQDIPFRTGVYTDKRKKREKVNKRNMDKWMQNTCSFVYSRGREHMFASALPGRVKTNICSFLMFV